MARVLFFLSWVFLHDHSPYKQKGSTWLREHKGPDQTRRPLPWGRGAIDPRSDGQRRTLERSSHRSATTQLSTRHILILSTSLTKPPSSL